VCRRLNAEGILASLDHLGESDPLDHAPVAFEVSDIRYGEG
jgi:hypothetical protein